MSNFRRPENLYLIITCESFVPPGFADSGWDSEVIYCTDTDADPKKVCQAVHAFTEVTKLRLHSAEIGRHSPHVCSKVVNRYGKWIELEDDLPR